MRAWSAGSPCLDGNGCHTFFGAPAASSVTRCAPPKLRSSASRARIDARFATFSSDSGVASPSFTAAAASLITEGCTCSLLRMPSIHPSFAASFKRLWNASCSRSRCTSDKDLDLICCKLAESNLVLPPTSPSSESCAPDVSSSWCTSVSVLKKAGFVRGERRRKSYLIDWRFQAAP